MPQGWKNLRLCQPRTDLHVSSAVKIIIYHRYIRHREQYEAGVYDIIKLILRSVALSQSERVQCKYFSPCKSLIR